MVAPSIVDERPSRERQLIRFLAFALVVLVGISGLTARLVYLQFVRGQVYQAQAEQNRTVTQAIPSTRGLIYDRKGRLLVSNEPTYAIKICCRTCPSPSATKSWAGWPRSSAWMSPTST